MSKCIKKVIGVLKKSNIAILSFVLLLVIAGYINYEYNPDREKNLGQTVYVNGKDTSIGNVSIYDEKEVDIYNQKPVFQYANNETDTYKKDDTIAAFKYDRDNMFSELSENYKNIINNASTKTESVNEYQKKLDELLSKKNLITMVENIIKSKNIDDVVIIPTNNDNLNVVIKSKDEITKANIAQIQQTLVDQFGISASKITITVKQ